MAVEARCVYSISNHFKEAVIVLCCLPRRASFPTATTVSSVVLRQCLIDHNLLFVQFFRRLRGDDLPQGLIDLFCHLVAIISLDSSHSLLDATIGMNLEDNLFHLAGTTTTTRRTTTAPAVRHKKWCVRHVGGSTGSSRWDKGKGTGSAGGPRRGCRYGQEESDPSQGAESLVPNHGAVYI